MVSFLGLLDILSQNLDSSGTFMYFFTPHLNDQKLAKFGPQKGQLAKITPKGVISRTVPSAPNVFRFKSLSLLYQNRALELFLTFLFIS